MRTVGKTVEGPAVSVIMSTCGRQKLEYLRTAVESVLEQRDVDFELVLCNDGAGEEHSGYLRALAETDKRIRLIDNPESGGLAKGLNLCIGAARGKYLARMDDDDICGRDRLKTQAAYLEEHRDIDYVGCNAELIDEEGVWGYRQMPERPGKKDFLKYSPYIHPSVMFRREVFDSREKYRTDSRRGEDYELFMRLSSAGHEGGNIQKTLFYYREDRNSYKRRELGSRLDEVRIRYHGFTELGLMLPWGWLYMLRPLAAGCVPGPLIYGAKKLYHGVRKAPGKQAKDPARKDTEWKDTGRDIRQDEGKSGEIPQNT